MIFYWDEFKQNNFLDTEYLIENRFSFLNYVWEPEHMITKEYDKPGIWFVQWMGLLDGIVGDLGDPSITNTLKDRMPEHVRDGLISHKIIMLVDNSLEGKDLEWGSIERIHEAMDFHGLPDNSICFITGSLNSQEVYDQACQQHNTAPRVKFLYYDCTTYMDDRVWKSERMCIEYAVKNPRSKSFLSLNQTVKKHRMEHLMWLITNKYHTQGTISGSWVRHGIMQDQEWRSSPFSKLIYLPEYLNHELLEVLHCNLPLQADYDMTVSNNPDSLPDNLGYFNPELYKHSLLSFVTESEYPQDSTFITEKTWKVLRAGHPFIILGSPLTVARLRELGFETDLCDIDHSYDNCHNHVLRFKQAHAQLEKWINTDSQKQRDLIIRDLPKLRHNFHLIAELMPHFDVLDPKTPEIENSYLYQSLIKAKQTLEEHQVEHGKQANN